MNGNKHSNDKLATKLVSIIIPVHNTEKYIERCLFSLVNQTFQNIEILIVNDGSTDNSMTVCDIFEAQDKRISITNRRHSGVSVSRNFGISKSKGDYITFVDSDDWLEYDAIENMVNIIERENVDCVRATFFRNSPTKQKASMLSLEERKYYKHDVPLLLKSFVSGNEQSYVFLILINKNLLDKLKPFNSNIHMMEDTCFFMDLLSKINSIYLTNLKTYHYFKNYSSASMSPKNYIRNIDDTLLASAVMKETLINAGLFSNDLKTIMSIKHLNILSEYSYTSYMHAPEITKRIIYKLRHSKQFRELAAGVDQSKLTIGHRNTVKYLLSNDDTSLYRWFILRHIFDKLKTKIKRIV